MPPSQEFNLPLKKYSISDIKRWLSDIFGILQNINLLNGYIDHVKLKLEQELIILGKS